MPRLNTTPSNEMTLQSRSSRDMSLFSFICNKDEESLSALLEAEVNLQVKDSLGRTPLTLAALLGQDDVISMLLSKGSDVNSMNSSGTY